MSELPTLTHEEVARYSRHLILDEVGVEGQRRIKAGRVLCIGTGGLDLAHELAGPRLTGVTPPERPGDAASGREAVLAGAPALADHRP